VTEPSALSRDPGALPGNAGAGLRDPSFLISLLVPALIGFYLFLTSTTYLIPGIWPYDAKRILQFALLLILFLAPALNRRIRGDFGVLLSAVPRWLKLSLLCVAGWGVISALINSQSIMHALNSLSEVALLSELVLGIFVVAACRRIAGRWFDRTALAMIALTGLAVGLQELVGVAAALFAGLEFNFYTSLIYFSWPRFYNQVQSWVVPALVALPLLFTRYRLARIVCFIVLGLQWYIILASGARGAFVSICTAFIFALIFLPAVRRHLLKWQVSGFALGALVFSLVLFSFEAGGQTVASGTEAEPSPRALIRGADHWAGDVELASGKTSFYMQSLGRPMVHLSGRTMDWLEIIDDSVNNPLLGIGPMNYACTSPRRVGHPHNFPLQLAAEWGMPVALVVCLVFLFLSWRIGHSIRQGKFGGSEDTAVAGLLFTGALAAAFYACLSGVMVMPASQVTGLLVCGMLLGLYRFAPERPVTALQWGFIPGLLLALGLLGLGIHELRTMEDRESRLHSTETGIPRIWQNAKVCRQYIVQNEVKY
jgi:hypothetical protein